MAPVGEGAAAAAPPHRSSLSSTNERTGMRAELAELWRFRDLLRQLIARELKVRYKNSAMGFVWSIVPPVLQVIVYTFLFRHVMNVRAPNYSAYLLVGLIPWTFFATATLDSSQSLLNNYPIIRKVYMPREIIPMASVAGNFIHFLLGWCVFFGWFFVFARLYTPQPIPLQKSIVFFPLITLVELLFVGGVSLWVSALNVFYEDVKFMLQTLFGLLLFLMPVFVPTEPLYYSHTMQDHPWIFKLYMLNPLAAIIDAYRKTLLQPVPSGSFNMPYTATPLPMDWINFTEASVIAVAIGVMGYAFFNSRKWRFVERP